MGTGTRRPAQFVTGLAACAVLLAAGCGDPAITPDESPLYAPGPDLRRPAEPGAAVGHRLMQAGEYELAIDAFTRAALEDGMTPEVLMGLGSANLGLGRLAQAERLLRGAAEKAPDWPEAWNNLAVVLMEQGKLEEARLTFRKAYALDDGQSDAIRDNLRLSLAKTENADTIPDQNQDYKLVRRGSGDFLIRQTP